MKIINFDEAKARRQSKGKAIKHLVETDNGVLELQRQYREMVRFFEQWYDEHVVGKDEDGAWIYK